MDERSKFLATKFAALVPGCGVSVGYKYDPDRIIVTIYPPDERRHWPSDCVTTEQREAEHGSSDHMGKPDPGDV